MRNAIGTPHATEEFYTKHVRLILSAGIPHSKAKVPEEEGIFLGGLFLSGYGTT